MPTASPESCSQLTGVEPEAVFCCCSCSATSSFNMLCVLQCFSIHHRYECGYELPKLSDPARSLMNKPSLSTQLIHVTEHGKFILLWTGGQTYFLNPLLIHLQYPVMCCQSRVNLCNMWLVLTIYQRWIITIFSSIFMSM